MFGIDPAFDGMASEFHFILGKGQHHAGGDPDLLADKVHAGDRLGDRMFNLQTRIHLDEKELTIFIQEFHRADAKIAHAPGGVRSNAADFCPLFGTQDR